MWKHVKTCGWESGGMWRQRIFFGGMWRLDWKYVGEKLEACGREYGGMWGGMWRWVGHVVDVLAHGREYDEVIKWTRGAMWLDGEIPSMTINRAPLFGENHTLRNSNLWERGVESYLSLREEEEKKSGDRNFNRRLGGSGEARLYFFGWGRWSTSLVSF